VFSVSDCGSKTLSWILSRVQTSPGMRRDWFVSHASEPDLRHKTVRFACIPNDTCSSWACKASTDIAWQASRCLYSALCMFNHEKKSISPLSRIHNTSFISANYGLDKHVSVLIISPPQSTAGHRLLQLLALSFDLRLLASSSRQPSCANRHSTWPEGVLHYVNRDAVSTLELAYPNGSRFYGWYGQPTATSAC
jgi:hypothetical protein